MAERDGLIDDLMVIGGIAVAAGLGWWMAGDAMRSAAVALSAVLAMPAAWLGDLLGPVNVPFLTGWLLQPAQAARDVLVSVAWHDLPSYGDQALVAGGRMAGLVSIPACAVAACACWRLRPDIAYRRRLGLTEMIAEQARVWPAARRPMAIDPSGDVEPETHVDSAEMLVLRTECRASARALLQEAESGACPETGSHFYTALPGRPEPPPLGRAMRPEEWLDARCLRDGEGRVEPESVEIMLAQQLTRPWSPDAMRPHERAYAAAMAVHAAQGDRPRRLIDELATAFAECRQPGDCAGVLAGQPQLAARINAALERHDGPLRKMATNHYWMETALLGIWVTARTGGGILAPAALLWLKSADRNLWYAIQCHGANVVIEAAGIYSHYLAEKQYGIRLPVPHVHLAAESVVEIYLDQGEERWRARARRETAAEGSLAERLEART